MERRFCDVKKHAHSHENRLCRKCHTLYLIRNIKKNLLIFFDKYGSIN